jgi:hypothetical protein
MSAELARERRWLKKFFKDVYQNTNQFVVVALTNGYAITQTEAELIGQQEAGPTSDTSPPSRFARQAFRGRILGDDSPHLYLEDPCDLAETTSPNYTAILIEQHTEFLLTQDYFDSTDKSTVERNDRVNVYLEPGDGDTPYNLERGWATGINRKRKYNKKRGRKSIDCTSLKNIWNNAGWEVPAWQPATPDSEAPECAELGNGDIAYPCRENMDVTLIVFYHGSSLKEDLKAQDAEVDQQVVFNEVKATSVPDNVVFLIPRGNNKSYGSVKDSIKQLEDENNITIKEYRLGAWSAGATGFATAYTNAPGDGGAWTKMMLADPSPHYLHMEGVSSWELTDSSNVYMKYRPDNWIGQFSSLGAALPALAEQIGNTGGDTDLDSRAGNTHHLILQEILKKITT